MTLPILKPISMALICRPNRLILSSRMMCEQNHREVQPEPWFKSGLRFQCTQCGDCCSGQAGSVLFSELEGQKIASRLNITVTSFYEQYCRKNMLGQWELKEVEVIHFVFYKILDHRIGETDL